VKVPPDDQRPPVPRRGTCTRRVAVWTTRQPAESGARSPTAVAERARATRPASMPSASAWRAGGGGEPEIGPPLHELLRVSGKRAHPRAINFRPHRDEISTFVTTPAPPAARDPSSSSRSRVTSSARSPSVPRPCGAAALRRGAPAWSPTRTHRDHQLHERHTGPTQGRAAHAIATSGSTRPPSAGRWASRPRRVTCTRSRSSTATAGHGVRRHRHGWQPRGAAQGGRRRDPPRIDQHGVTLLCGAPAVASMVLDAAAEWATPCRAVTACGWWWPERRPRPAPSSASRPSSAGSSSRSTAHRDGAAAHHEPPPGRARRAHAHERAIALNRAGAPRSACGCRWTSRARCWPAQRDHGGLLGAARGHGCRDRRRLVPHRRRRLHRRRPTTSRSRTARRT